MKKLIAISILTYLLFTINSSAADQTSNRNNLENKKVLEIGVLLPLSGEYQDIGESFLKAIQLALYDIANKNITHHSQQKNAAIKTPSHPHAPTSPMYGQQCPPTCSVATRQCDSSAT